MDQHKRLQILATAFMVSAVSLAVTTGNVYLASARGPDAISAAQVSATPRPATPLKKLQEKLRQLDERVETENIKMRGMKTLPERAVQNVKIETVKRVRDELKKQINMVKTRQN